LKRRYTPPFQMAVGSYRHNFAKLWKRYIFCKFVKINK
jgi:hypothetical protein